MKFEHQVGAITPTIDPGGLYAWSASWLARARKADREGKELIVVEVVKGRGLTEPDNDTDLYQALDSG